MTNAITLKRAGVNLDKTGQTSPKTTRKMQELGAFWGGNCNYYQLLSQKTAPKCQVCPVLSRKNVGGKKLIFKS